MKRNIFKSKLVHIKDIDVRNKTFEKLSDKRKRQEIAWDALNMLLQKKIKYAAKRGSFYWDSTLNYIYADNPKEFQQKIIETTECGSACRVCARGAIMLSQIRLGNKISPNDSSRALGNTRNLRGFTMKTMMDMELLYEKTKVDLGWIPANQWAKAHPYTRRSNKRLVNIFCNVIANGDFKKTDITDYIKKWRITTIK